MASEFRTTIESQFLKKKAAKLKPLDRTLSIAIENYASTSPSRFEIDSSQLDSDIVLTPTQSLASSHSATSASSAIQEFTRKSNIFYIDSSSNSLNNYPDYKHPHTHHLSRKPNIRRSDTLNLYGTGVCDIRKAHSSNSNDASVDHLLMMSRRTNSMRHTTAAAAAAAAAAHSHEFSVVNDASIIPPLPIGTVGDVVIVGGISTAPTSSNRRNCRMHKSFHERRHDTKRDAAVIETVKCHSLGDDGSDDELLNGAKRKLSPKFNSANSSLENEVFQTRSNSRNKIETETIDVHDMSMIASVGVTPSVATVVAKKVMPMAGPGATHKHSSHSLDKPHHNFRRIARATQSFYLNPNQYEELRLQRAMASAASVGSGSVTFAGAAKRVHSASLRTKPFRETLADTKKSKSFVSDPFAEYDMSPHRRDSNLFDSGVSVISDAKKSPRLSSNLMLPDAMRQSYDGQKATNFDGSDMDYDGIMRAYRQNQRNSSIASGTAKKKLSSKKKKSVDGATDGGEIGRDVGDGESTRKRKRIVCIIVTVFLSLVFASVFVVVFMWSHSTVTQIPDNTRRIFAPGPAGNRDSPIHHHNSNTNGNYTLTIINLIIHRYFERRKLHT